MVPPPVLPFMKLHKPHDTVNTRVTLAFAFPFLPNLTSIPENFWQWCVRAIKLFQRSLGINVAATNLSTLDCQRTVDAKQNSGLMNIG